MIAKFEDENWCQCVVGSWCKKTIVLQSPSHRPPCGPSFQVPGLGGQDRAADKGLESPYEFEFSVLTQSQLLHQTQALRV